MTALDLITKEDLELFKSELFAKLEAILLPGKPEPAKKLLRSKDVRKMLDISSGTLQTLRTNGSLPFTKVGKIPYYKASDINKILELNHSNPKAK